MCLLLYRGGGEYCTDSCQDGSGPGLADSAAFGMTSPTLRIKCPGLPLKFTTPGALLNGFLPSFLRRCRVLGIRPCFSPEHSVLRATGRHPSLVSAGLANLQKGAAADTLGLSGSSVLIVLASGDQLSYPIPNCAVMFLTGSVDVNGDGNNDVVAQCPEMLIVLLGNGDGTLQALTLRTSSRCLPESRQSPQPISAARSWPLQRQRQSMCMCSR